VTETQQEERLQLAVPFGKRAARVIAAAAPDIVGLVAFALVLRGVYVLWGQGWTLIAAGIPLAAIYAWREFRAANAPTKRGED
jgi:hypothetical protein